MLREISVTDFRNYASTTLVLDDGLTVLHGDNGQGKTNLLEAVHVLATATSVRPGGSEALVREGADTAWVRGRAEQDARRVDVVFEIPRRGRLRAAVNGDVVRRRSDALGHVRAVLFSPDDLELVKGGPAGRRLLLDTTAALCRPAAADRQTELERVLRQRTTLLRTSKSLGRRPSTLDAWDEQLLEHGMSVLRDRTDTLAALAPLVQVAHDGLTSGGAGVGLTYRLSWGEVLGPGQKPDARSFRSALEQAEREERERGNCLVGPHRDDLVVHLDGRDARTTASQGESRTIALALRLAVHRLATTAAGPPLLLLDDVVSELDPARSESLLSCLPHCQTLLTTAEPPDRLPLPPQARRVRVVAGRLEEE